MTSHRRKLAVGAAAVGTVLGAGAAIAGTGGPREDREAIVADAAARVGVTAEELRQALDAALEEHGAVGPPVGHRRGLRGPADLGVAADYLGLTVDELRAELMDGGTLAEVAEAEGKSADGLVDVLVEATRERIEALVTGERAPRLEDAA